MAEQFPGSVRLGGKREPEGNPISRARARALLLGIARICVPEMLSVLRSDVVIHYPRGDWKARFRVWCKRFHVVDPWLVKCASDTVKAFAAQVRAGTVVDDFRDGRPTKLERRDLDRWDLRSLSHEHSSPVPAQASEVAGIEVDLAFRTREQELERLRAPHDAGGAGLSLDAARDELRRIDALFAELGWVKPPTKAWRHFQWLARYQFGGSTVTQMGQVREDGHVRRDGETDRARSSVTEAIRDTAEVVGLTLRPPLGS